MDGIDLSQLFAFDKVLLESALNPLQIILSLSITLLMAIFIYWIYKKTYNGVLYSKNFNTTLIMTALTVDAIMIGISGNIILSLGLVGALSVIRFRTAVKDPKDTAFLFWAITIGVINGVTYYELSLIASVFIGLVLFVLSRSYSYEPAYMLVLKFKQGSYSKIKPQLEKHFKKFTVRSDSLKGDLVEKVIELRSDKTDFDKALSEIRAMKEVDSSILLASNGDFSE